jgi:hypothetical protein
MNYKRFGDRLIVTLDKGEEVMASLVELCEKEGINAAMLNGIGYTDEMRVRVFDNTKGEFVFRTLTEPREITALNGNIVLADNGIYPHLHIMAADLNMNVAGGHLISCKIAATAEIIIDVLPDAIRRGESNDSKLGGLSF